MMVSTASDGARQSSHLSMGQRGQAARMEHSARLHAPCLRDNEGPWPGRHPRDKRIADAVSMTKEHWGVFSRLGVEQMLCATFRLNAFAEYSEGNTQDLYRHMGSAYRLGTTLSKSFGDHFSTSPSISTSARPKRSIRMEATRVATISIPPVATPAASV